MDSSFLRSRHLSYNHRNSLPRCMFLQSRFLQLCRYCRHHMVPKVSRRSSQASHHTDLECTHFHPHNSDLMQIHYKSQERKSLQPCKRSHHCMGLYCWCARSRSQESMSPWCTYCYHRNPGMSRVLGTNRLSTFHRWCRSYCRCSLSPGVTPRIRWKVCSLHQCKNYHHHN